MLELKLRGWDSKGIAREFGTCPKTVRRYLRGGCWTGYSRLGRPPARAGKEGWLEERLIRHGGKADVIRRELESESSITVPFPPKQAIAADRDDGSSTMAGFATA